MNRGIKALVFSLVVSSIFLACQEEEALDTARTINVGYRIEVNDSSGAIGDSKASYSFIGPNFQRSFSDDLERMPVILDRFMEVDSGDQISLEISAATAFKAFMYENDSLIWTGESDSVDVSAIYQYEIDLGYDSTATSSQLNNYRLEIDEKYPEWDDFDIMYARDSVILGTDSIEISNIRSHLGDNYEGSFSFRGRENTVAIVQASGRQGMKMVLFVEGDEIQANFIRNSNGYSNGVITYVIK